MDWNDNDEQREFREQVRAVIAERLPARYRALAEHAHEGERQWEFDRKADDPEARRAASEWASALAERGWVAPHWPREYGGGGMTVAEQFIFRQEMAEASAPAVGGSAVGLLGPTLIVHGTEEQRQKYLPPILAGERVWAQGYSEPGAGSDLASLQTRAVRDGDEYVVNGQKIWDLRRPRRGLDLRAHPHRPRSAEASRHLVPPDRGHPRPGGSRSARSST